MMVYGMVVRGEYLEMEERGVLGEGGEGRGGSGCWTRAKEEEKKLFVSGMYRRTPCHALIDVWYIFDGIR